MQLDTPISRLEGIYAGRVAQLRKRGLMTLRDLIEFLPRTWVFEAGEMPIREVQADQIHTVRGEVVATNYTRSGRPRFEATLDDGSDQIALVWFNASWMRGKLTPGMTIRVRGKVGHFRSMPQMVNPKWQGVDQTTPIEGESRTRPVYPASGELTSEAMEKIISCVLDQGVAAVREFYDAAVIERRRLLPRAKAIELIHRPGNYAQAVAAHRRLVYDELMLLQIGLGLARRARTDRLSAPVVRVDKLLDQRIRKRFPFEFTTAQLGAAWEIVRDMKSGRPMNRLLQGDVGSGKTAVALYAMLVSVANKLQAAILAPTEVLAEQHFLSLSGFLAGSGVQVGLLTQRTKKGNTALREGVAAGQVHIAVGTQALIQGDVDFANLGLVVVDEQHRFGVKQRAVLKGKGLSPHYLVMTATPIPRTLALSFFADFDLTTISELPPGRLPITTRWLRRDMAYAAHRIIQTEVHAGHQAYYVLPRIDEGQEGFEEDDVASLTSEFEKLSTGPLQHLRLAMLHGRMKSQDKQQVMQAFRDREFDVLLATSVIEVGVDVPNATVIVIDSAEQFGLAQLHQLRGRVGRGSAASQCVLLSDAPTEDSYQRMQAMVDISDGFDLAEADLKMRGPGDFFGTRQSGLPQLKVADLTQELEMLKLCRGDATELLDRDPDLRRPEHAALREELLKRFGDRLGLASIG